MTQREPRRQRAFTLIEMVITVAIVGLLATAAVPLGELGYKRLREQELRTALREMRDAIDAYKTAADEGRLVLEVGETGYPHTLAELVEGVEDARSADGRKIYFLRRLPRDPFFPDAAAPAADTWGLRSYSSPPDAPEPGEDVYDVYSLSPASGINGVPYREW
jgi:general secretion pathway protein G